jgi:hypothetical protein
MSVMAVKNNLAAMFWGHSPACTLKQECRLHKLGLFKINKGRVPPVRFIPPAVPLNYLGLVGL